MFRNWVLVLVIIFLALQLFIIKRAQAEYRVYRLGVKYSDKQKVETEVITSLDDLQYATYYKITPTQTTRLIDHWMCWGRTSDFKKYCAKPVSKVADASRTPAAQNGVATPQASDSLVQSPNSPPTAPKAAPEPVPLVIQ